MDDLSSLKTSLALSDAASTSFVTLFSSRLEASDSDVETAAILESFWEVLDGEKGENHESRDFRMSSTLRPASMDLIPLLSPLLVRPSPVNIVAEKLLLEGVGKFSSPREVLVAVGERLEALLVLADAEDEDADGQDEDEDEENEDDTSEDELEDHDYDHHHHSHSRYTPPSALASELPSLLSLLATSIPRLTSKRSLPTLLNLASMLPPVFSSVPPRPATARLVVDRLREVVEAARSWGEGTEDWNAKAEQKSILIRLLAGAVVQLHAALDTPSANATGWSDGMPNLVRTTLRLIPAIDPASPTPTLQSLLLLLSSSSPSPTLPTFALLLLASELNSPPHPHPHHFFSALPTPHSREPALWLDLSVEEGLLSTAAGGGLGWVRCCIDAIRSGPLGATSKPKETTIQIIFQTYLTPLASSPTPSQRKTIFDLLSTLLSPTFVPPRKALDIMLPLMSRDSPLPMLRPAGLHFVRALLGAGGGLGWLQEQWGLETLSEAAWRLPFATGDQMAAGFEHDVFAWSEDGKDEDGETWIRGPGPVFVVLALGIYQQTVGMDSKNESGIRSPSHLRDTDQAWLTPLRLRLDERRRVRTARVALEKLDEEEDESAGAWEAVEFALEGVEAVVKRLVL